MALKRADLDPSPASTQQVSWRAGYLLTNDMSAPRLDCALPAKNSRSTHLHWKGCRRQALRTGCCHIPTFWKGCGPVCPLWRGNKQATLLRRLSCLFCHFLEWVHGAGALSQLDSDVYVSWHVAHEAKRDTCWFQLNNEMLMFVKCFFKMFVGCNNSQKIIDIYFKYFICHFRLFSNKQEQWTGSHTDI